MLHIMNDMKWHWIQAKTGKDWRSSGGCAIKYTRNKEGGSIGECPRQQAPAPLNRDQAVTPTFVLQSRLLHGVTAVRVITLQDVSDKKSN